MRNSSIHDDACKWFQTPISTVCFLSHPPPPPPPDIDECLNSSHSCHANADCTNTPGSYVCSCRQGYTGNGRQCTGKAAVYYIWLTGMLNNKTTTDLHQAMNITTSHFTHKHSRVIRLLSWDGTSHTCTTPADLTLLCTIIIRVLSLAKVLPPKKPSMFITYLWPFRYSFCCAFSHCMPSSPVASQRYGVHSSRLALQSERHSTVHMQFRILSERSWPSCVSRGRDMDRWGSDMCWYVMMLYTVEPMKWRSKVYHPLWQLRNSVQMW